MGTKIRSKIRPSKITDIVRYAWKVQEGVKHMCSLIQVINASSLLVCTYIIIHVSTEIV